MSRLVFSPEVQTALPAGRPVVALESTVIAHGLPAPHNLETALSLGRIVREAGIAPATVGLVGGRARVGMSRADLELMAQPGAAAKVSLRDLGVIDAVGALGATTVAAGIHIAHMVRICVFSTGASLRYTGTRRSTSRRTCPPWPGRRSS